MKAIIYLRKSSESEEKQSQSLEWQKKRCLEYANQYNFEIVKIIEESKSAKQPWRPWFNEMMCVFWEKKADIIICWSLNRLSRNPIDEGTIKWLTQQWIIKEIHSTDWISNWQNILLMSVHFGMANQFLIDMKKSVIRWMQQKFEKWWALWIAPTGYWNNKNTNEYDIDPVDSEFVKEIFYLRSKKFSFSEISRILFEKWFKTKNWKPKSVSTIEHIIKNQFYVWFISWNWEKNIWKHKTFISKEIFEKVNNFWYKEIVKNETFDDFIFAWFIKYQGKAMRFYKTKWNIYYREATWITPPFNISQKMIIDIISKQIPNYILPDFLEEFFISWLIEYFEKMTKVNKKELEKIKNQIEDIKIENKELIKKNIKSIITDDEFKEIKKDNLKKLLDLEEKLKDYNNIDTIIEDEAVELFKMFTLSQKQFETLSISDKATHIKNIIVELNFNNKKELKINDNKLFELIRNVNFTIWHPHKESNLAHRIWNPGF